MDIAQYKLVASKMGDFHKEVGEHGWKVMAQHMAVYADGTTTKSGNTACHWGLRDYKPGVIGVISGLMKPSEHNGMLEEEEAIRFLDYLLQRSPFSSMFVTKSYHQALADHAVIVRTDVPSNWMAAALVETRLLWEYPYCVRAFSALAEKGVPEDLALYLGHIASGSLKNEYSWSWGGGGDAHMSFSTYYMGDRGLRNFLAHTPEKLNSNFEKSTNYSGYSNMWGAGKNVATWINDNFQYKPKGKESTNPFVKAKVEGQQRSCPFNELIDGMVNFYPSILEYIKEG